MGGLNTKHIYRRVKKKKTPENDRQNHFLRKLCKHKIISSLCDVRFDCYHSFDPFSLWYFIRLANHLYNMQCWHRCIVHSSDGAKCTFPIQLIILLSFNGQQINSINGKCICRHWTLKRWTHSLRYWFSITYMCYF